MELGSRGGWVFFSILSVGQSGTWRRGPGRDGAEALRLPLPRPTRHSGGGDGQKPERWICTKKRWELWTRAVSWQAGGGSV